MLIVVADCDTIVCSREGESVEGFPFPGSVVAFEQVETISTEFPRATDVWLFDDPSRAPWHASLNGSPRGPSSMAPRWARIVDCPPRRER
jgi:hypothetical protein